ncbi:hypothetical protein AVEN_268203-1 [Araneus ventricosus]|uniref:Uncharacterized protein n=1 Tax=Araneus ventricosus TaxID=182803 RepID=A0A4Y2JY57_ARAVE|nr:hypothetical protein AVEN_268203-1 [Araneus ventricosus]
MNHKILSPLRHRRRRDNHHVRNEERQPRSSRTSSSVISPKGVFWDGWLPPIQCDSEPGLPGCSPEFMSREFGMPIPRGCLPKSGIQSGLSIQPGHKLSSGPPGLRQVRETPVRFSPPSFPRTFGFIPALRGWAPTYPFLHWIMVQLVDQLSSPS